MKVSTGVSDHHQYSVGEEASRAERLGYDYFCAPETTGNPFIRLAIAADRTAVIRLQSSIALAFIRSPMDIAYTAWDLQNFSKGRFMLGLGSQVRGHIVRRFGISWSSPAKRMREYVVALRTIWHSWNSGAPLNFKGDFYAFNLMTPFFDPGPTIYPIPPIHIAAVGPKMLQVAGEVCDGVILHPFSTLKYIQKIALPNLHRGAAKSGRSLESFDISSGGMVLTGASNKEIDLAREQARMRVAFYASTRSYASIMELHGWADTAQQLYRLSAENNWNTMPKLITDDILDTFVVSGTYDTLPAKVVQRFGSYATTVNIPMDEQSSPNDEQLHGTLARIRSLQS